MGFEQPPKEYILTPRVRFRVALRSAVVQLRVNQVR